MKPAQFEYHAPEHLDEALEVLARLGDDARLLAGGQSLIPMLSLRLTNFEHLVDLGRVHELRGVTRRDGLLSVGAMTPDVALSADAPPLDAVPLLSRATSFVGHFQIRNRGTVGGSIAHSDPAAEYPAVALALDARLEIISDRGW